MAGELKQGPLRTNPAGSVRLELGKTRLQLQLLSHLVTPHFLLQFKLTDACGAGTIKTIALVYCSLLLLLLLHLTGGILQRTHTASI